MKISTLHETTTVGAIAIRPSALGDKNYWPEIIKPRGTRRWYLAFAAIGLILIGVTRLGDMEKAGKIVLPIFHSVAGLIIFLLPIVVVRAKRAPVGFAWVAVGGALIGLGGIALAFLKSGRQFLFFSEELVFDILAPLLLLMTLAFTWGYMKLLVSQK